MYPFPRRKELGLAIYSSFFHNKPLNEKIFYTSLLFRTLVAFRVSKLYIINPSEKLHLFLKKMAKYALSPPYLKKTIPLDEDLSKVGLLAPMNIPYHTVHKFLVEGESRIGEKGNFGIKNLKIKNKQNIVLVTDSVKGKIIQYPKIYYSGFSIYRTNLKNLLKKENLIIASRSGKDPLECMSEINEMYNQLGITLLIGPPEGELLISIRNKDYLSRSYNFIPRQGVSDVRVEEAIFSALSILNFILE